MSLKEKLKNKTEPQVDRSTRFKGSFQLNFTFVGSTPYKWRQSTHKKDLTGLSMEYKPQRRHKNYGHRGNM